jgi:hypothetical protein
MSDARRFMIIMGSWTIFVGCALFTVCVIAAGRAEGWERWLVSAISLVGLPVILAGSWQIREARAGAARDRLECIRLARLSSTPLESWTGLPHGQRDHGALVLWTYSIEDWRSFSRSVLRRLLRPVATFVLLMGGMGGILVLARGVHPGIALGLSLGLAAVLAGLAVIRVWRIYQLAPEAGKVEVRIGATGLLMGRVFCVLRDSQVTLESVELSPSPPELAFRVAWSALGGTYTDVLRLPIPAGCLDEARRLRAIFVERRSAGFG